MTALNDTQRAKGVTCARFANGGECMGKYGGECSEAEGGVWRVTEEPAISVAEHERQLAAALAERDAYKGLAEALDAYDSAASEGVADYFVGARLIAARKAVEALP